MTAEQRRADDRAVNGDAAVRRMIQHPAELVVFERGNGHIERASADDGAHGADQDHIHHAVGVNAETSGAWLNANTMASSQARGDEDAVPVDRHARTR